MKKTYRQILEFIKARNNFLLTTHMGADGDAYGAISAFSRFLDLCGKQHEIVFHDQELETRYQFFYGWEKIKPYSDKLPGLYDAAIILDVPSKNRIGDPAKLLPPPENCIKIDHHPIEDELAHINLVDITASSTCLLVYEVISRSDVQMDFDLANALFGGIMYDTGRFSFSNTRQRDFEIAAHLLKYGVKPHDVANKIFFSSSFQSMRIIGRGLADMEVHLDGKLCIIFLPLEVMKNNNHNEIEELANYSVAIKGAEVGLFIREAKPNFFKVSFRSKGLVNVMEVAKVFGGGGHAHAAGARFEGNYNELKKRLISEVAKQLK